MTPAGPSTRIGIVEDDVVLRESLALAVASVEEFTVVGVAGTLEQGFTLAATQPDVLLVDLALPDGTGIDLIRHVHGTNPRARSLVISVFGDVHNVVAAIEAGADGYLLKGADTEQIASAIHTVLAGGAPISAAVASHILGRIRSEKRGGSSAKSQKRRVPLTAKEVEVLEYLAKGLSFKEVARLQGLSPHTIADHVKAIYRKLEVNSRGEAVFEGVQTGIIKLND